MTENALTIQENNVVDTMNDQWLTVDNIVEQQKRIQECMKRAMRKGTDYGLIPGCGQKPSLLKPGAEKLASLFRLCPEYDIDVKPMKGEHREYEIECKIRSSNGMLLGVGVGSCSTMEKKYRYVKERERKDVADVYNTVKKMAKKRAFVDAILTVTAASDIFTQDVEDMADYSTEKSSPPPKQPTGNAKKEQQESNSPLMDRFRQVIEENGLLDEYNAALKERDPDNPDVTVDQMMAAAGSYAGKGINISLVQRAEENPRGFMDWLTKMVRKGGE